MAATCTKKAKSPIRASDRAHSPHEEIPSRAYAGGDFFVTAAYRHPDMRRFRPSGIRLLYGSSPDSPPAKAPSALLFRPCPAISGIGTEKKDHVSSLPEELRVPARKPAFVFMCPGALRFEPPFLRHACRVRRPAFRFCPAPAPRLKRRICSFCNRYVQDYNKPVTKGFAYL